MAKSTLQLVATRRQIAYGAPTRVGLVRDSNLAPALYTDGAGAFRLPPSRRQTERRYASAKLKRPIEVVRSSSSFICSADFAMLHLKGSGQARVAPSRGSTSDARGRREGVGLGQLTLSHGSLAPPCGPDDGLSPWCAPFSVGVRTLWSSSRFDLKLAGSGDRDGRSLRA
jgi:hypothetical protein